MLASLPDLQCTRFANTMARGRAKLTKCQRSYLSQTDSSTLLGRFPTSDADKIDLSKLTAEPPYDSDTMATICFHCDVKAREMKRVSELISDVFLLSYKMSVPYMFQGLAQSMEMEVIRKLMLDFFAKENGSKSLKSFCKSKNTQTKVKRALEEACSTRLCEMILHLSTEDGFDMICDHANRHGHDTDMRGPPCACSLVTCIDCLEILVENSHEPAPGIQQVSKRPIDKAEIAKVVNRVDSMEVRAGSSANPWIDTIADVYDSIGDVFWDAVVATNFMQINCIKAAYEKLASINGIALWYAITAREMKSSSLHLRCKGKAAINYALRDAPEKGWQLDKLVNDALKVGDDAFGNKGRRLVAEVAKERGNAAFTKLKYKEAIQYYTHAIVYDAYEPTFSLNRAASFLKLEEYARAESDCSNAIMLDVSNHKAWFRRGISRAHQNKVKKAEEDFKRALQLRADDAEAYEELAKLSRESLVKAYKRMGANEEPPDMPSRSHTLLTRKIAKKLCPSASQSSNPLRNAARRIAAPQASKAVKLAVPSPHSSMATSPPNAPDPAFVQRRIAAKIAKPKRIGPSLLPSSCAMKTIGNCPTGFPAPSPPSQSISTESCSGAPSCVEEVISQVSFAIAFSYVLHQKTGVNVRVPLPCWNTTTAKT